MSLISHLSLKKDEDFPAIKKKKSRNPKPRDKWSLLWFIPSNVLNMREEATDGKGQTVKKGKRHGFDTYNQLGCKVCRKAFHKYQSLAFHTREENHGNMNLSTSRSNASWNNVGSRSVQTPAPTKRNSVELMRTYSEPSRKSSRLSIKPISYDDEIEILDIDDDTPYKSTKPNNNSSAKEFDEKKFAKLTLSAKRKIVEDYNNREEEEFESKKVKATKKDFAKKYVEPKTKKTSKSVNEIEIIDIDDDEPIPKKIDAKPAVVEITKMTRPEDEELLLAEDDDDMNEDAVKKRKPMNKLKTPNQKKVKVQNAAEKSEDMVEVKSSSGKSMFVNKATLEKIMAAKAPKKTPASTARSSLDEKLLAEKSDDLDVTKKKSLGLVGISKLSPKKTRSRGL
eukprot:TRINITY_DN3026_c0_g1_i7.p1 TRINITY_DN3026_c0_g1~~TRINITY_DN3026_c0_g1_i7.p1  ORF type:complete len:395 (-),score=123.82 TRINITY_DN3026_c0_g1_i7:42-1226(-)